MTSTRSIAPIAMAFALIVPLTISTMTSSTTASTSATSAKMTKTVASAAKNSDINWEAVFYALHQVETSGKLGPVRGDNGAALGPYQIHRGYHKDSGVAGPYSNCSSLGYARSVVRGYMARYCTERRLGRKPTAVDIARIHNGGPMGYKKKATLPYVKKFERYYNEFLNRNQ